MRLLGVLGALLLVAPATAEEVKPGQMREVQLEIELKSKHKGAKKEDSFEFTVVHTVHYLEKVEAVADGRATKVTRHYKKATTQAKGMDDMPMPDLEMPELPEGLPPEEAKKLREEIEREMAEAKKEIEAAKKEMAEAAKGKASELEGRTVTITLKGLELESTWSNGKPVKRMDCTDLVEMSLWTANKSEFSSEALSGTLNPANLFELGMKDDPAAEMRKVCGKAPDSVVRMLAGAPFMKLNGGSYMVKRDGENVAVTLKVQASDVDPDGKVMGSQDVSLTIKGTVKAASGSLPKSKAPPPPPKDDDDDDHDHDHDHDDD